MRRNFNFQKLGIAKRFLILEVTFEITEEHNYINPYLFIIERSNILTALLKINYNICYRQALDIHWIRNTFIVTR